MQESTAQVTVLVPINDTKYLFTTLESIEAQTLLKSQFEVLLVADRIPNELIKAVAQNFSFTFDVVEAPSAGIVSALNYGIDLVKTEYIARMDADDLMLPHRLDTQLREFERNPKLVGLGGGMIPFRNDEKELREVYFPKSSLILRRIIPYKNLFAHPTMMLKTSAIREVGMYRNTKSEDWDLWSRLIEVGEMTNLKSPLIKYRLHEHQISNMSPTIEPEVSTLIQLSKWMRKRNLKDFPVVAETSNQWLSELQKDQRSMRKVNKLLHTQVRRVAAQKVLALKGLNSRTYKLKRIYFAAKESPTEVLLTLMQRLFKFL
ncbi:Glycosyltransferase 2-like [Candidatus Nanopelagicaceae bacterium]